LYTHIYIYIEKRRERERERERDRKREERIEGFPINTPLMNSSAIPMGWLMYPSKFAIENIH
jgi:hypothetical protein